MPTGAMVRATPSGKTDDGPAHLLGFSQVTSLGAEKEITADFSAGGALSRRVKVMYNNLVVFSNTLNGAAGPLARTAEWPAGVGTETPVPMPDIVGISWRWAAPVAFEISNQSILGDEIRVTAQLAVPRQLGNPVDLQLSSIALQASGIPEINLVADIAEAHALITAKLQTVGGVLVLTWDTANPRQVLQSADEPNGPWNDIPGATTSPYLLVPTGTKQFIRVIQR